MKFGKVVGQVVSTRKEANIHGLKLAVIQYLDFELKGTKHSAVCTDAVKARPGDIVLVCSSSSARFTKQTRNACTDATIVGVVDSVSKEKKDLYLKK
jgi:microcompartment protein CcmK/EutM